MTAVIGDIARAALAFRCIGNSMTTGPGFDTAQYHAPRKAAWRKASGEDAEMGVYRGEEGAQSRFRIGFDGLLFNAFYRLAASVDDSVTCQTRSLGLDNSAS